MVMKVRKPKSRKAAKEERDRAWAIILLGVIILLIFMFWCLMFWCLMRGQF